MINRHMLQGRLTRDPEVRTLNSGSLVTGFTVAWSEKFRDNENKLFMPVNAWGKTGEMVAKYFHKGQEIVVEGRLTQREWTANDGSKRVSIEMTADHIHFCGPKQDHYNSFSTSGWNGVDVFANDFSELSGDDKDVPF